MQTIETERGTITIAQKGEKMENLKEKAKAFGKKAWKVTKKYGPYALGVGCFYIFCDQIYKIGLEDGARAIANESHVIDLVDNEAGSHITAFMGNKEFAKIGTENFQLILKRFPEAAPTFDPTDIINF